VSGMYEDVFTRLSCDNKALEESEMSTYSLRARLYDTRTVNAAIARWARDGSGLAGQSRCILVDTYLPSIISEVVAETSQIILRGAQVLPKLLSYKKYCRRDRR
jgi:hypothetical protein